MLGNGLLYGRFLRSTVRRLNGKQLASRYFINDRPPPPSHNLTTNRYYADDHQQNYVQLPTLSDHPPIVYPSFFKTIRGFIQIMFVIKPHIDQEFDMAEFIEGSKQAVATVSQALAREDYESLEGLVSNDVIQSLRHRIFNLSPEQKQLIAVQVEDIYTFFPYEVGIMFDKEKAEQKMVEITVIYYTMRGLKAMQQDQSETGRFFGFNPELRKRSFICNYRFVREYTKGVESSWTINMINHFMPDAL